MADEKPIIVIKKVSGHGGHHGGAWKVAYADFVTAMMAFFLVMWIVNSTDSATKAGIAEYFSNAGFFNTKGSVNILSGNSGILEQPFSPHRSSTDKMPFEKTSADESESGGSMADSADGFFKPMQPSSLAEGEKSVGDKKLDEKALKEIAKIKTVAKYNAPLLTKNFKAELAKIPDLKTSLGKIEIQLEPDGMVLEIMDTDKFSMFESGSAVITPKAKEAFLKIAELLEPFTNKIDVLGHTDAYPYNSRLSGGYSNWELSTDRANAARRLLVSAKIPENRIAGVIGRADKYPRLATDPYAKTNRRIAIKMRFEEEKAIKANQINTVKKKVKKKNVADAKPKELTPEEKAATQRYEIETSDSGYETKTFLKQFRPVETTTQTVTIEEETPEITINSDEESQENEEENEEDSDE